MYAIYMYSILLYIYIYIYTYIQYIFSPRSERAVASSPRERVPRPTNHIKQVHPGVPCLSVCE